MPRSSISRASSPERAIHAALPTAAARAMITSSARVATRNQVPPNQPSFEGACEAMHDPSVPRMIVAKL